MVQGIVSMSIKSCMHARSGCREGLMLRAGNEQFYLFLFVCLFLFCFSAITTRTDVNLFENR